MAPNTKRYGSHRKWPLPWLSTWFSTSVLCCWEHRAPSCLGKELSNGSGTSCQAGWVTLHCWVRGIYSVYAGFPLSCCKLDLLKCTTLRMEHTPLKEVRRWGPGLAFLVLIHLLIPDGDASPSQLEWYVKPGQVPKAANLPLCKNRWAYSVSHWYNHWATVFVPSIALEGVVVHTEALTKFTQQALNNGQQNLSSLNTELSLMRKTVLQNRMALDISTASQGGTFIIVQTECWVLIPDESAHVSSSLYHIRFQVNALSDLTPHPED